MPRRTSTDYKESKYAPDLVKIMQAGKGPFTRSMLATELGKLHPSLYKQELMNEVSYTLQADRWSKAGRFKVADGRKGWYELS